MRRSRTSLDKAALLAWCKEMTAGHDNVDVKNFSSSWNDGLAFCALMHKFFPAEVPFSSLEGGTAEGRAYNCELAFRVAEKCAGVQPLFDAEDMAATYPKPDEKSVITYVALLLNALEKTGLAVSNVESEEAFRSLLEELNEMPLVRDKKEFQAQLSELKQLKLV